MQNINEAQTRRQLIDPALEKAGWYLRDHSRVKQEMPVAGYDTEPWDGVTDYCLCRENGEVLAVVEAKRTVKDPQLAEAQGIYYAREIAKHQSFTPFVFLSNGSEIYFLEVDRVPRHLVAGFFSLADLENLLFIRQHGTPPAQMPINNRIVDRPYQHEAIRRISEALEQGKRRALLVMATGTGKTYTAFQIIWRLWKAGVKKRILFLVDRNILADQTRTNDFKPFGQAMTKITNRMVDKSYEIYLSLYQAVTGTEEEMNIYKQFSPEFFDLVIIDECHRGSAADDARWRQILEYFHSAAQIGLTATPKETRDVSNIEYFGEPIYSYSLRQGIADGFLAPYKVVRIGLDKDLDGWRPEDGQTDKYGRVIEDREYNDRDYDRDLVLERRTEVVAAKVSEFLRATDRFAKTIIFCENIDHAERMRQAMVNANPDLAAANSRYVMRITGDNDEGKAQLDNFIDPESIYPVIACTSRLMGTGVDAQTCHLIVLDRIINSMTEFKQIIGRGTRINEDYNKFFFTIMDFRRATALFADPDFDGDPVQIYEPRPGDPPVPPDDPLTESSLAGESPEPPLPPGSDPDGDAPRPRVRYVVDSVPVSVVMERVQFLDEYGKLITESLTDYTRKAVHKSFASLDDFLTTWNAAERKQVIIEELAGQGVFIDELAEQVGRDYDPFDLICHVAFDQPPLTRRERADRVRKRNVFGKYGEQARAVLEALLQKYADSGITSVESMEILRVDPLRAFGTPVEIINLFGSRENYLTAIRELETALYQKAA